MIEPNIVFSGNIYIFHAFDIGDDINLEKIERSRTVNTIAHQMPKYFKNYHAPLSIELPSHPKKSEKCISTKVHSFGVVSLLYKIPFTDTLANIRKEFGEIHNRYQEQSILDVKAVFKHIEPYVIKSRFYNTRSSYMVLEVDPIQDQITVDQLKEQYGSIICSTLRFETAALSEYQRKEMISDAIGYFRGDLIIVDTDAAFVYDEEYPELLDFFEFANIQQLELRYFDRMLDDKLNRLYETEAVKVPLRAYLPFIGSTASDPIAGLSKLRVDISVITERLESSIKLAGEPYFSELYELLVEKLALSSWRSGIERKLSIINNVQSVYRHNIDVNREDMLTVLIIILIFIELVIGLLNYIKGY